MLKEAEKESQAGFWQSLLAQILNKKTLSTYPILNLMQASKAVTSALLA